MGLPGGANTRQWKVLTLRMVSLVWFDCMTW
jgi:hypothetical protein